MVLMVKCLVNFQRCYSLIFLATLSNSPPGLLSRMAFTAWIDFCAGLYSQCSRCNCALNMYSSIKTDSASSVWSFLLPASDPLTLDCSSFSWLSQLASSFMMKKMVKSEAVSLLSYILVQLRSFLYLSWAPHRVWFLEWQSSPKKMEIRFHQSSTQTASRTYVRCHAKHWQLLHHRPILVSK